MYQSAFLAPPDKWQRSFSNADFVRRPFIVNVKVRKRSNFVTLFGNSLQGCLIYLYAAFLGMILIICQEMDLIESFKMLF